MDLGVDVGANKIRVRWHRDLPKFESQYNIDGQTAAKPSTTASRPRTYQYMRKAPSKKKLCAKLKSDGVDLKSSHEESKDKRRLDLEALEDLDSGKENPGHRLRIRKGSGSDDSGESADDTMSVDSDKLSLTGQVDITTLGRQSTGSKDSNDSPPGRRTDNNSPVMSSDSEDDQDIINSSQKILDANKENSAANVSVRIRPRPLSQLSFGAGGRSSMSSYQNLQRVKKSTSKVNHQYITVMSLEVHVDTRQKLSPDPDFDPVSAVFYSIQNDIPEDAEKELGIQRKLNGIIHVCRQGGRRGGLEKSGLALNDLAISQVRSSLTQFTIYHWLFTIKSRRSVKKCDFYKNTIKVCVSYFDCFLGHLRLE